QPFAEVPLSELLDALPEALSYSLLRVPVPEGCAPITLARRDLFDARFQAIASESDDDTMLDFLNAPSDLVPWRYEGGLKTWECCVDLAAYLAGVCEGDGEWVQGKTVLEIGCGTAVPSLLLFQRLLESLAKHAPDEPAPKATSFHLQDYNRSVLELVTLPNILLTWYASPLAEAYRASEDHPDPGDEPDLHLSITPTFLSAFQASLSQHRVNLRFFSGSWDGFDVARVLDAPGVAYNVVLTSETIYRTDSTSSLLRLLREACLSGAPTPTTSLPEDIEQTRSYTCLVAAKVLYFGVGGGVAEFVRAVETDGRGRVDTVWEQATGVARRILRITW
ncbi:hypothetical protein K488DRAFT_6360, partial [Vararia minispora EC-137]